MFAEVCYGVSDEVQDSDDATAQFVREVEVLLSLKHKCLISYYGFSKPVGCSRADATLS